MVTISSLWLPILLSGISVFIISSVIHMVLTYHRSDFKQLPDEDSFMDALQNIDLPPGEFVVPFAGSPKAMASDEYKRKLEKGPVGFFTFMKNGPHSMTGSLVMWFVYSIIVSISAAYIASRVVPAGGDYLTVFRFVGATAFYGYALALMQNSIWYKRAWSSTFKSMFDGLIYALFTAGIFGWLWPGC